MGVGVAAERTVIIMSYRPVPVPVPLGSMQYLRKLRAEKNINDVSDLLQSQGRRQTQTEAPHTSTIWWRPASVQLKVSAKVARCQIMMRRSASLERTVNSRGAMLQRLALVVLHLLPQVEAQTECKPSCCAGKPPTWSAWATTVEGGGSWTLDPNGAYIRYDFENDRKCGGSVGTTQKGTASTTINVTSAFYYRVSAFAVAESNYEFMKFKIDGTQIFKLQGQDDGVCKVSTCIMCNLQQPDTALKFAPGAYTALVQTSSRDPNYHQDAYFQLQLSELNCQDFTCTNQLDDNVCIGTCLHADADCSDCSCPSAIPSPKL